MECDLGSMSLGFAPPQTRDTNSVSCTSLNIKALILNYKHGQLHGPVTTQRNSPRPQRRFPFWTPIFYCTKLDQQSNEYFRSYYFPHQNLCVWILLLNWAFIGMFMHCVCLLLLDRCHEAADIMYMPLVSCKTNLTLLMVKEL